MKTQTKKKPKEKAGINLPWRKMNPELDGFRIPKSAQQSVPIQRIYKDGIIQAGGKFSKTWRFSDINYAVASTERQKSMILAWCGVLNLLPTNAASKISLVNRKMDQKEFARTQLLPLESDKLDGYRVEYNDILRDKARESNDLIRERYLTISVDKKTVEEARTFFNRVAVDITGGLRRLDSNLYELPLQERLRLFHDIFRPSEQEFQFDLKEYMRKGHDFKDAIAPECVEFKKDCFELGDQVGRVLFLREYANFIKDELMAELMDFPRNMVLSIDITPVPMDVAVKDVQKKIMAVETDITRWQTRQNSHNNFSATIPYELEQARQETKEFMDDLTMWDQHMMYALLTLTHFAENEEQLDGDTETLQSIAGSKGNCQLAILKYQQEDGLNTCLPYGLRKIDVMRTLTTESLASLMPFRSQEIRHNGGIYYGVNAVSHNLILCNRENLLNGNGFILGVSGSGKSFAAKQEIASVALATDHDIIVVDPEREYGPLVRALGGEIITISATAENHINALDISEEYGDGRNPLVLKSEFVMSLIQQLMDGRVGPKDKSIIDRCIEHVYRDYIKTYQGEPPTLRDLYQDMLRQTEAEARSLALALELFATGSLNVFAHQTNVDTQNRILCYDIQELGENLKPVGLLVMLDAILNRVISNRQQGKHTHVYIDEIYLFFGGLGDNSTTNYSGEFLYKAWKRFRKYAAMMTGITQNVEECLLSNTARMMFANSEFLLMFNQAPTDQEELAKLLNISETQLEHITDAQAGHGLIKVGGNIVPFINDFPRDTALYKLMTTKPGEGI